MAKKTITLRAWLRESVNRLLSPLDLSIERPSHLAAKDILPVLRVLETCGLTVRRSIDVGAHLGRFSILVHLIWPEADLVLIEPQADLLEEAKRRIGPRESVRYLNVGAGPQNEMKSFSHHSRKDSSTFASFEAGNDFLSKEIIQVQRLDTIIEQIFHGNTPDIVKIDCEGWDLEVLKGLGKYLGMVHVIFIEAGVANCIFENDVHSSIAFLDQYGYKLFDFSDAARTPLGVSWNADLCFVHRNSKVWKFATTWRGNTDFSIGDTVA